MHVISLLLRLLGKLFVAGVLAIGAYVAYTQLKPLVPCAQPITYSLGTFDERFGISREDFLKQIEKAEGIWEKPVGIDLFQYDPAGSLKINLIYDIRQATTQRNQELTSSASDTKQSAQTVQARYKALKEQYGAERATYEAAVATFNVAQQKYESEVTYYNKKGGAPASEYKRLNAQKESLEAQAVQLDAQRKALNARVEEINNLIDTYNLLVEHVNETVSDINETAGKEFDEGLYVEDGLRKYIDIYEYSTKLKLLRVLAHELGHALSLEHNGNKQSIMYSLNQGSTEKLSEEDLSALKALCVIN